MTELLSQVIELNLADVNDVSISSIGNGKYELYIGDVCIVCKCHEDLKTLRANVNGAYEKHMELHKQFFPKTKVFDGILENFKAGAK